MIVDSCKTSMGRPTFGGYRHNSCCLYRRVYITCARKTTTTGEGQCHIGLYVPRRTFDVIAQIPLGSTRHAQLDSTRHVRRVEPMHFGCVDWLDVERLAT